MQPIFLLGSKVTQAPDVQSLTCKILTENYHRWGDDRYRKTPDSNPPISDISAEHIRWLLCRVRDHAATCSNVRKGDINYEQIAQLLRDLNKQCGTRDYPAIQPFVELIRRDFDLKFPASPEIMIGKLARESTACLKWIIHDQLAPEAAGIAELGSFFHALVTKDQQSATIVTLNHDTHLERALALQNSDTINLGFESVPESCHPRFSPHKLAAPTRLKVLKLHGSVDWFFSSKGHYVRASGNSAYNPEDDLIGPPLILSGTADKLEQYQYQLFPWLWTEFQNQLRTSTRIVISGYGFKDTSVNQRLNDWLHLIPDSRICIIHPRPDELMKLDSLDFRVAKIIDADPLAGMKSPSRITIIKAYFEEAARSSSILESIDSFAYESCD